MFSSRLANEKKVTLMPYSVWTEKLAKKLDVWYKKLAECLGNGKEAAYKLGLEERCFDVIGETFYCIKELS